LPVRAAGEGETLPAVRVSVAVDKQKKAIDWRLEEKQMPARETAAATLGDLDFCACYNRAGRCGHLLNEELSR